RGWRLLLGGCPGRLRLTGAGMPGGRVGRGRKPRTLRSRTPTPRTPTPRTLTSRTRTSPSRLSDGRPIGGPGGAAGHGPAAEEYGAQPQRDGHDGTDEAVAGARTTTGGGQVQYRENRAGRSRRDGRQPTGARSVGAHAAAGAGQDQPGDGQPEGARGQGQVGPGASVTDDAALGGRHECCWNAHVAPLPLLFCFSSASLPRQSVLAAPAPVLFRAWVLPSRACAPAVLPVVRQTRTLPSAAVAAPGYGGGGRRLAGTAAVVAVRASTGRTRPPPHPATVHLWTKDGSRSRPQSPTGPSPWPWQRCCWSPGCRGRIRPERASCSEPSCWGPAGWRWPRAAGRRAWSWPSPGCARWAIWGPGSTCSPWPTWSRSTVPYAPGTAPSRWPPPSACWLCCLSRPWSCTTRARAKPWRRPATRSSSPG